MRLRVCLVGFVLAAVQLGATSHFGVVGSIASATLLPLQVPQTQLPAAELGQPNFGTPNFTNPVLNQPLGQAFQNSVPSPAVQTGLAAPGFYQSPSPPPGYTSPGTASSLGTSIPPGVNFQVNPNPSGANPFLAGGASQQGVYSPPLPTPQVGLNQAGFPPGNVTVPNQVAGQAFDPFAGGAGAAGMGQIPQGYPNMPAAQSSGFLFGSSSGNGNQNAATLFGAPQLATYGPGTGSQSPGLLNNPDAYGNQTWSVQSWQRFWQQSDWQRLFHAFRIRHTFISGQDADKVGINDTEIATSLSFPNWLNSKTPLTISPGFIIHNWQGPDSFVTGDDLPGSAYSAYLSFDHSTALNQQFGGEANFTAGVYSSFDTFTSHSTRFTGLGLIWIRFSPQVTFKFGAEYFDRISLKLLPAGGIFWTPDANTRYSFYFPRPKFARRFPNLGNTEIWGYISAEYGGGSWTIRREANFADQVDLNDYRITAGLEWIGVRGVTGFAEIGYVFQRELLYRSTNPLDSALGDSMMFRGGFAF